MASAKRRLRSFLDQIDELLGASFPHEDAKDALLYIKSNFEIRLRSLDLPPTADPTVVDGVCTHATTVVQRYTVVLGFILRSTNTRNAFELQFPLKRLVRDVISSDAKLLMSSEWDFVPFTFPMNLDLLPNYVLIGAPAPESNNVLITPLAGHEIGHSAWRKHLVKSKVDSELLKALATLFDAVTPEAKLIKESLTRLQRSRDDFLQRSLNLGLQQLEEIFCDLFGLYVFGPSFLYAFEYFLAPGGRNRFENYPSNRDRVRQLLAGAKVLGFEEVPNLFERWTEPTPVPSPTMIALGLTDAAVISIAPKVRDEAFRILKSAGVVPPDPQSIEMCLAAFYRHEPANHGASLAEIITAGWTYVRREEGLVEETRKEEYQMLGELMLKSVEVSEFHLRVARHA